MTAEANREPAPTRRLSKPAKAAVALLCVALAAAAAVGVCACSQHQDETVHLLLKVPRTGHEVVFDDSLTQIDQVVSIVADEFEANYDKADVDIEVEVFEQNQYDSAIEESFDTPRSPDLLYGDYFNMSTYIHSGRVVPLDDVAQGDVRDGIYGYLWNMSTVGGKVYMMPYLARQNVLGYSKPLFSQAGLDDYIRDGEISSWSIDEWTHVLDTLAQSLPDGTFPIMMYAGSSQGDTHIMTLMRSFGSDFFDEDGHFNLSTPQGVAALRWIQDGVARGWYPPHSENLEIEDCSSLFRGGQLAIYMVNNASIGRYGDEIGLVNFPGPDEDGCATTFISGFEVFDNGDPAKVQAAKDFLSYVYSSDELMGYAAGAIPASVAVAEKYRGDIEAFDLFLENQDNVVDFTGNNPDTRAVREIFYGCIHDLLMGSTTPEETAKAIDERCNKAIDDGVAASKLHD